MSSRAAFNLAEVLLALLILSLGILSIIALFPAGMRSQAQVRYQTYASIKAMELSDALAQHTKSFSYRVHEVTSVDGRMVAENAAYGSYARFDAENVWSAGGQNGVYPVPIEIARRLDSPGDEIQRVLDSGGQLYYPDPRPVRGFSESEATNPSAAKIAPELQHLVFAVVGAPQQNALPQHPCLQGPSYQLYPFAPQGRRVKGPQIRAKAGSDSITNHVYVWDYDNAIVDDWSDDSWEFVTWETLASRRFAASPWRSGLTAFRNLCYFGWIPIEWKLANYVNKNMTDPLPLDGKPLLEDTYNSTTGVWTYNTIARFAGTNRLGIAITSPVLGLTSSGKPDWWYNGNSYWRSDFSGSGASYLPGYDATVNPGDGAANPTVLDAFLDPGLGGQSFKDFVNDPGMPGYAADPLRFDRLVADAIGDLSSATPASWTYQELGTVDDRRLPSLQQRYLYRWLALKLWRDVTVGSPYAGTNPLEQDLWLPDGSVPAPADLHPARVLALSHLADAAMRVGGMRLPYWEPKHLSSPATQPNGGLPSTSGESMTDLGISNLNAVDTSAKFPGSLTDVAGPRECTAQDVAMAKRAHENCLRWAIAYADRNPRCNILPRPANRQVMTDRFFWTWDLFDASGNALRSNTPRTWQGTAIGANILPAYKVVPRPGIDTASSSAGSTGGLVPVPRLSPGMQIQGNISPTSAANAFTRANAWFTRMAGASEPTFGSDQARASRYWLAQPIQAQDRMRQLVFWAAEWKNYEDSESAPSAPGGVELLSRSMQGGLSNNVNAAAWTDFDPSESPITWFGRDRRFTFSAFVGTEASGTAFNQINNTGSRRNRFNGLNSIRQFFDAEGMNHTFGLFGADRNGSGLYERGAVKPSVRMRAIEVARFNLYDPVAWCHTRK